MLWNHQVHVGHEPVIERQNPFLFFTGIEISSEFFEEMFCTGWQHVPAGLSLCNKCDKSKPQLFTAHKHCP